MFDVRSRTPLVVGCWELQHAVRSQAVVGRVSFSFSFADKTLTRSAWTGVQWSVHDVTALLAAGPGAEG